MPRYTLFAALSFLVPASTVFLATSAFQAAVPFSTAAARTLTHFPPCRPFQQRMTPPVSFMSSSSDSSSSSSTLPDVGSMRAGEMKKELESYGISTKSFLEKTEFVAALQKARREGKTPIQDTPPSSSSRTTSSTSSSSTTTPKGPSQSRDDLVAKEIAALQSKKASELKKELESLGVSTKSFFEKSEFVKALAEARVDGVKRSSSGAASAAPDEGYAEYKNVEVLTGKDAGPRSKSPPEGQSPQGRGGNPFGNAAAGGGNPFAGATGGGMGGIADMLKNMGMGGGGGRSSNPFGGGGGANPFGGGGSPFGNMGGDAMGKAQELMKNPKVMEIISRAQKNPRVMAAITECISNPAAFAKYQNDPEISKLMNELKRYM